LKSCASQLPSRWFHSKQENNCKCDFRNLLKFE